MKGSLRYVGDAPVHSLKLDWTPGMEVSLAKLHTLFGSKSNTPEPNDAFVAWFYSKFMDKLQGNFELILEDSVPQVSEGNNSEGAEEQVPQKLNARSGSITLDAAKVETASSLKEAQANLKKMKHPDAVGEIDIEKHEETSNKTFTKAEEIRRQKKTLSTVMTGDDLQEQKNFSSLVLTEDGAARGVVANNKQMIADDSARMANISKRANVLTPDIINNDGSTSQVIVGDDTISSKLNYTQGFAKTSVEGIDNRKNKNFKGYQTFTSGRNVSPEEISNAPEQEAKLLIAACKDVTTLRVAIIHAKNNGNHRIRELIERRIRSLPPRG